MARRAKRPVSEVLAVFVHMMTNAGSGDHRGSLDGWSDEDVAIAIDAEVEHVQAIREAMQGKTLDGEHLTGWEKRQPIREDGSSDRSKNWRELKKREKEEAERTRTHANAVERPEEKREDPEENRTTSSLRSDDASASDHENFERFYLPFPKHVEPDAVLRLVSEIIRTGRATVEELEGGAKRFAKEMAAKEPRYIPSPVKWLEAGRWKDGLPLKRDGPPACVTVQQDTDEGRAWDRFFVETTGKPPLWRDGKRAFETKWPPAKVKAA